MKHAALFLSMFVLFGYFSSRADVTVKIIEPSDGAYIEPCSDVLVKAEVTATAGEAVKYVYLYYNNKTIRRLKAEPWEYTWKTVKPSAYYLSAKVVLEDETEVFSDSIKVKCGNVSGAEQLINGGFDCGTISPWRPNIQSVADAEMVVYNDGYFDDDSYLGVDIIDAGGGDRWAIQLFQTCPIDSGHTYEISLLADAVEKKMIYVGMQLNVDPWTSRFGQDIEIDGANLYGPYEFTSEVTDPLNDLVFHFATDNTPVFIDNVQVVDKSATSVKSKNMDFNGVVAEYELYQAYPNPFNMNTTIRYSLSTATDVSLDIYNMVGQKVFTLVSGQKSAGQHIAKWNGLDNSGAIVPSGVYIYRLQINNENTQTVLSRKVLLMK